MIFGEPSLVVVAGTVETVSEDEEPSAAEDSPDDVELPVVEVFPDDVELPVAESAPDSLSADAPAPDASFPSFAYSLSRLSDSEAE